MFNIYNTENKDELVNVDVLVDNFNKIILTTADNTLRTKKVFKGKKSRQKWFDADCSSLRKHVIFLGRQLQKDPGNPHLRGCFFQANKKYKLMLRKAKYKHKQQMINSLEEMHEKNPRKYWEILDRLRNANNENSPADNISPTEWFEYFQSLLQNNSVGETPDTGMLDDIKLMENEQISNELSYPFKESEVSSSILKLANKKAPGADGIINEMLKAGLQHFVKPIAYIFNMIFTQGNYPIKWTEGIISAIFKNGDPSNPENYRGITLCSNLSKLFSSILNNRLVKFLQEHNLSSVEQIGFKKKGQDC